MAQARGLRDARNILLPSIQVEKRSSSARGDVLEQPAGQIESAQHRSGHRSVYSSLLPRRASWPPPRRHGLRLSSTGESTVGSTSGSSTPYGSGSSASPSNRFAVATASRMMVTVLSSAQRHRRILTGPGKPLRLDPIAPAENVEEDKLIESSSQPRMSSVQVDAAFEQFFDLAWNTGEDLQIDSQVATPRDDFAEPCAQVAKAPWVVEELPAPPGTPDISGRRTQVRRTGPSVLRRAHFQTM